MTEESIWPKVVNCHDITLSSPEQNLAFDEVLLTAVESNSAAACLRFWQLETYCVVLGRSNNPHTEVDLERCDLDRIPVLRRTSGGGTVLIGPGCLCYSLVLPVTERHRSLGVSQVTAELMSRIAIGLNAVRPDVEVCGTSDLIWRGLKFSGNAQRWLRKSFIHHGTLLFDFDVTLLGRYLRHPQREPAYRRARRHEEFVGNLELGSSAIQSCLQTSWNAVSTDVPGHFLDAANKIASSHFGDSEWKIGPSLPGIE